MPEIILTKKEEQLFLTLSHDIMKDLKPRVDKILKESILALRGDVSKEDRTKIKNKIIESLNTYGSKNLEL